jgi:hypothetical protein
MPNTSYQSCCPLSEYMRQANLNRLTENTEFEGVKTSLLRPEN